MYYYLTFCILFPDPDCNGKACSNGGTLDLNTCTCTCVEPEPLHLPDKDCAGKIYIGMLCQENLHPGNYTENIMRKQKRNSASKINLFNKQRNEFLMVESFKIMLLTYGCSLSQLLPLFYSKLFFSITNPSIFHNVLYNGNLDMQSIFKD